MKVNRQKATFTQNLSVAFDSIKSQKLRTWLTAMIIAIGMSALVGIITAAEALAAKLESQFTNLGASTFTIQNRALSIQFGPGGRREKENPPITYRQAIDFKKRFDYAGAKVSLSYIATGISEIKKGDFSTDPNVAVMAGDEYYVGSNGYEMAMGRNLTEGEVSAGSYSAILGWDIYNKLFDDGADPLGKTITVRGYKYLVVGVLAEKGSSSALSGDRMILIPYSNARIVFSSPNRTYAVNVLSASNELLEPTIEEAYATMRSIRKLQPKQDNDFSIIRSDSLAKMLTENLSMVNFAGLMIGLITMLGASISLMNIMLVSVTERTKEIGTRKAMGAKASVIRGQFLTEAVVICQLGGVMGILLGLAIGNAVGALIDGVFVIPWGWITFSFVFSIVVGVISGFYPAVKASRLDPIEALRYE